MLTKTQKQFTQIIHHLVEAKTVLTRHASTRFFATKALDTILEFVLLIGPTPTTDQKAGLVDLIEALHFILCEKVSQETKQGTISFLRLQDLTTAGAHAQLARAKAVALLHGTIAE